MTKARDLANAGTALTSVSATELGYVDGVTSAIQTQIDSKIGQATAINPTIVDAKGDIIAATAADTPARLAVGSNDQVLTADSSTATGLKWATPSAGGMTLISNTVASAVSAINLTSIPSTYKQLVLIWSGIDHSTTGSAFGVRFNNSSGATDYYCSQMSYNTNALSTVNSTDTTASGTTTGTRQFFGSSANQGTTGASRGYLVIDNYASTSLFKSYYGSYFYYDNINVERAGANYFGYFRSTSAISSIDIVRLTGTATLSNQTNTSIRLYGVA